MQALPANKAPNLAKLLLNFKPKFSPNAGDSRRTLKSALVLSSMHRSVFPIRNTSPHIYKAETNVKSSVK